MTQNGKPVKRPRYWLITSPRTASNMLVTMLNLDEQDVRPANHGGYFFLPAIPRRFSAHFNPMKDWTEEERTVVDQVQQKAFDTLQDHVAAAEQEGQITFVKEHAIMMNNPYFESQYSYGDEGVIGEKVSTLVAKGIENPTRSALNLTSMPDEFLLTWYPTVLIRHPAMMLPSLYRTCLADFEVDGFKRPSNQPMAVETTMKWARGLYDFYSAHFGEGSQWPIVLDADDVMTHPELVAKYAQLAGLDPDKVRFSWDKASEDKLNKLSPVYKRMLSSINASSKVDSSKVAGKIDIAKEAVKWRAEFGEEGGRKLEQWVRDAMPDYQFMHAQRLVLE